MIDRMTRYNFILLNGEQEAFLRKLQELGVVDVTRSVKPVDEKSSALLSRAERLREAREQLSQVDFEGVKAAKVSTDNPAEEYFSAKAELEDLEKRISDTERAVEERKPWGDFDKEKLDDLEKRGYRIRWYREPKRAFSKDWESMVPLQVIKDDGKDVGFVTISDDPSYSFPVKEIQAPAGDCTEAENELSELRTKAQETKARLTGLKSFGEALDKEYARTMEELDRYLADEGADKTVENHICIMEGFAPVEEDERLETEFNSSDILWYKSAAKVEDNPPIKLKNNAFTRMFTVLTDMYGRPEYNGFDPTPFISVFFLLFFAFCMGDAGYGLVLLLIGLAMRKSQSTKDIASLVMTLGAGTIVIGLFFHTFFSIDLLNWKCIPDAVKKFMLPSKIMGYDGTMVLAILVGIFHLCVAFVVKAINATKQKGFVNSLGTWGWTLLIVGGVIVGGIALTGALDKAVTKWVIIVLGCISALGIFILNDIHRNPLANFGTGLWETYNTATGLLGDVLSYLRLYALGLAGAMLGQAFNSLGIMALGDKGIGGWIAFLLIVLVGHVLNMAMAALGAFVHPLRLNFLEFFKNSGYETSGRNYNPLVNKE